MKKIYNFIVISLIVILDQCIKKLIITSMKLGENRNFLGQIIRLNYVANTGGAFSLR